MENELKILGRKICIDDRYYRVISIHEDLVTLCMLNTNKIIITYHNHLELRSQIRNHTIQLIDETINVIDISKMSDDEKFDYENKREFIAEFMRLYWPISSQITAKIKKPDFKILLEHHKLSNSTAWRLIRKYLQSGMQEISLIDQRRHRSPMSKPYNYTKKTGRPRSDKMIYGVAITPDVLRHFEEACNMYKTHKEATYFHAYLYMLDKHYSKTYGRDLVHVSASEKPTYRQFQHYISTRITKEEKDVQKMGRALARNDKRVLQSSARSGITRPGQLVEIDALEMDLTIVGTLDRGQYVGKPIVYMMVDVYSGAITAISVSFENNSIIGLTNLFINQFIDKHDYVKKFGIENFNEDLWPSEFIPEEVRCDRGADFKSDIFGQICKNLNIKRTLVTGATGSYKPFVEKKFGLLQQFLRPIAEHKGIVSRRYGDKSKQEATLTIEGFEKVLIEFVLYHNNKYNSYYQENISMLKDEDFDKTPASIWKFGSQINQPMMITQSNRKQYLYNLLLPKTAKLSRDGITYKWLKYMPTDKTTLKKMYSIQNKRISIDIRIDPRDVSTIYYLIDEMPIIAKINDQIPGMVDYMGMSWKEYEEYLQKRRKMDNIGKERNRITSANLSKICYKIFDEFQNDRHANTNDVRNKREIEKKFNNHKNRISRYIGDDAQNEKIMIESNEKIQQIPEQFKANLNFDIVDE